MALQSLVRPVCELDKNVRGRLYSIFEKYYDHVSREEFERDLSEKSKVILLLDVDCGEVVGFSTLKMMTLKIRGRLVRGLFSGDTIVEKAYWGDKELKFRFVSELFLEKLRSPLTPTYWFLISKGYKTYLLMANNLPNYFPRFDKKTPPFIRDVMDSYASTLYGKAYDPNRGVIEFEDEHAQLKSGVADISLTLLEQSSKVRFFHQMNPKWKSGHELVCISEMKLSTPLFFLGQFAWKKAKRAIIFSAQKMAGRVSPTRQ